VRRAAALIAVAATTAALLGLVGASASPTGDHRQERTMRLVVLDGYFVDNDPSGQSGGDLFGSSGELRRRGHKAGKYSSACTLASPGGAQCQATLILRDGGRIRGRIQLAGNYRLEANHNRVAIVGGTNKFRGVRGDATIQTVDDQGSVQRLHMTILR
jgi:Dirigent-like protein